MGVVKAERFAFVGAVCGPCAAVTEACGVELEPCDRGTKARVGERQAARVQGEDSVASRAAVRGKRSRPVASRPAMPALFLMGSPGAKKNPPSANESEDDGEKFWHWARNGSAAASFPASAIRA